MTRVTSGKLASLLNYVQRPSMTFNDFHALQ